MLETKECFKPLETNLWYKCDLWAWNIFFLLINLRIIQITASKKSGEHNKTIFKLLVKDELLYIKLVRKVPKYKLPVSPINIFEGNQLKYKNAVKVPIIGNR